ncbi:hypothetical protein TNCV_3414841 [Trichonephila clavipes]|nr:hypothetical protein TNCV_3414841 [Trichonephila clavipes]
MSNSKIIAILEHPCQQTPFTQAGDTGTDLLRTVASMTTVNNCPKCQDMFVSWEFNMHMNQGSKPNL